MRARAAFLAGFAMFLLVPRLLPEQVSGLQVASAGPNGEIGKLIESNEIRVVFSEPMVALGRIPPTVTAPYFRIEPAVPGGFRWSGTRTLIFTPAAPLPYATSYEVTIETSAVSETGKRLDKPFRFSFTTPTARLLRTSWYRKTGSADSPLVLVLHFNQPVKPQAVAATARMAFAPHEFVAPPGSNGVDRWKTLDPAGFAAFLAKVEKTSLAARSSARIPFAVAKTWNRKWFPAKKEMAVFETAGAPPVESWISIELPPGLRGAQGTQGSRAAQSVTVRLEPAFFVEGFRCDTACDPDIYNPLRFRSRVATAGLRRTLHFSDVTEPAHARPLGPGKRPSTAAAGEEEEPTPLYPRTQGEDESPEAWSGAVTPEETGFALRPARTYRASVDAGLRSQDGQVLGYTWIGLIENWHQSAFTSFGSGHGVWESGGGPILPFSARNLKTATQWLAPLKLEDLVPTIVSQEQKGFESAPDATARDRRLAPVPDKIQFYGLDMEGLLSPSGKGLLWAAVRDGEPITKARHDTESRPKSSLVQVTNLGISVKDSPRNTLVFVTRLDSGEPVQGARVSIRTADNRIFWTGMTGEDGIAVAPDTALREPEKWYEFRFLVTAEKDGDLAYVGSNWNEGVSPWMFRTNFDLSEARPQLRGSVFSDRGVYKLGEEVHLKAVLRSDTADGIRLLSKDSKTHLRVTDSHAAEIAKKTLNLSEWGTSDWVFPLPADGALGRYSVTAKVPGQKREVTGEFLVAAYRRPDFRVDANLAGESSLAGVRLASVVSARYLFGAPMASLPIHWTFSRRVLHSVPKKVAERFPEERWAFLDGGWDERPRREEETLQAKDATLDREGKLTLTLDTRRDAGDPWEYLFEGEVTDVSRQKIAGRASFRVDPAPWYIGITQPPFFAEVKTGLATEIVAANLEGKTAPGVKVSVALRQIQWHSVRRSEGKGFYTWETEKREIESGRWDVVTTSEPAPLHVPVPTGGFYVLSATAQDAEGRATTTRTSFYALGPGYTAWQRYDHNRIDLVPEKKTYRPGDTARLLVKSPWEKATALLTTEREGIRTHRRFTLTSTQQTVEVPIDETDIPNLYVSVLLLKGRTAAYAETDSSDPGKPSYRLGYAELEVEDSSKRLAVAVKADREEYRPAAKARVEVTVLDRRGAPDASEVTLWAVDYGVLSLTAYKTPEIIESVYVPKAIQVLNEDSRQNIVNRRVIVAKGAGEGGGGGAEDGTEGVRKDFRVLAFWLGSVVTDAQGKAAADVTLPESLTTYRIMAVAGDKASRFGWAQAEIRVNKPLLLKAALPRFLAAGDTAFFGSVLHSQLPEKGDAIVTMQSLDPDILEVTGEPRQVVAVAAKSSAEVRFNVRARAAGRARLRMSAKIGGESDAFDEIVPVEVLAPPETVAAYGQASPAAKESIAIPDGILPGYGGLRVELSSTALVGLSEGASYLVDYPYGCAEQRASSAAALLLASDLGEAFRIPGIEPAKLKDTARATLKDLEGFQCENGGFAFWKGECSTVSPYLTGYVLSVFQRARRLDYEVSESMLGKAYDFLEKELGAKPPADDGWWPAYTAWQAFAVKVLARGGHNVDSPVNRLFGSLDRMPVFAISYLFDALAAKGETGARAEDLKRRMTNAILPEGGSAHVEESSDPYLLWFWNSNVRTTAVVLESLTRHTEDKTLAPALARWLLAARRRGRWGNTQENAVAMGALVEYYRKFEKEVPDFSAAVTLGAETLVRQKFTGRSSEARPSDVPMKKLLAGRNPGERLDLSFRKDGAGTLHYATRLRYAVDPGGAEAMDKGITVERSYEPETNGKSGEKATTYRAGDMVRVTLTLRLPKERRFLAVTDPLPAGFEPVESWFATTASGLAREQREEEDQHGDWLGWWQRGGFDHVERHDDRVLLFATRLSEGTHRFSYLARATTAGSFLAAPARAEEMYEPEVFGRTPSAAVEVRK